MRLLPVVSLLVSISVGLLFADDPPKKSAAELDKACKQADSTYQKALLAAEQQYLVAKRNAAARRYEVYKEQLAEATKAGDFDRAIAIKAQLDLMEADPEATPVRPKDVVKFDGHSYALIREAATWHIAKRRCEQLGGHLACMETGKEQNFLHDLLKPAKQIAWVGGTDEEQEGHWVWITGHPIVMTGVKFNNAGLAEHHLMWDANIGKWNDVHADARHFFVCEWDD